MKFCPVVDTEGRVTYVNPLRVAYARLDREKHASLVFEAATGGIHVLTTLQPLPELLIDLERAAAAYHQEVQKPLDLRGSVEQGPPARARARAKAP